MRLKTIHLRNFRRFSDLYIHNIPDTAKLIVFLGPNGCGKSSLFDAFYTWHKHHNTGNGSWTEDYHMKSRANPGMNWADSIKIDFHGEIQGPLRKKMFYFRSAYRNEADFQTSKISNVPDCVDESRFNYMIENDASVSRNYARLAAYAVQDIYREERGNTTFQEYRERMIGKIKASMLKIFPDLSLSDLGNPLNNGTFKFNKGTSQGFLYKNLSGGEKACFDLLLDLHLKSKEFDNTIFCIDEPESHMNTRLQAALLEELYNSIPDSCQLCISTHAIGMLRKARNLEKNYPGTVAFIDFDNKDFDQIQVVEPIIPSRTFWKNALSVALDDMGDLILPEKIILCEGSPAGSGRRNTSFDAECYNIIFEKQFSQTQFVSSGNASEVENDRLALMHTLKAISGGVTIDRLIDRDDHSQADITDFRKRGIRVLSLRTIENYLLDDEVLAALCGQTGREDAIESVLQAKREAIETCTQQGKPLDDIKSAAGLIYTSTKKILSLQQAGNNAQAFMKNTLAPLLKPHMAVYEQLKTDIFA